MVRDFDKTLRISEIFYSIQGESSRVGLPTVFIRLTGCPLRCQYCDTTYAFQGGEILTLEEVIAKVQILFGDIESTNRFITVSGGEPLAQKACHALLDGLCDLGYHVSIETSGALDIKEVNRKVMVVMDIKTPGSLEEDKNKWANIDYLKQTDQIKFVICSQEDYNWTKKMIKKHSLAQFCEVLLSPSYDQISIDQLADSILKDKLPVRLQFQLHKYIWGNQPGH